MGSFSMLVFFSLENGRVHISCTVASTSQWTAACISFTRFPPVIYGDYLGQRYKDTHIDLNVYNKLQSWACRRTTFRTCIVKLLLVNCHQNSQIKMKLLQHRMMASFYMSGCTLFIASTGFFISELYNYLTHALIKAFWTRKLNKPMLFCA